MHPAGPYLWVHCFLIGWFSSGRVRNILLIGSYSYCVMWLAACGRTCGTWSGETLGNYESGMAAPAGRSVVFVTGNAKKLEEVRVLSWLYLMLNESNGSNESMRTVDVFDVLLVCSDTSLIQYRLVSTNQCIKPNRTCLMLHPLGCRSFRSWVTSFHTN